MVLSVIGTTLVSGVVLVEIAGASGVDVDAVLRAGVSGTLTTLAYVGIPLGSILAGVVVEGVGLVPTILGMGAIYLAVTVGMFFTPALRQMDAGRER